MHLILMKAIIVSVLTHSQASFYVINFSSLLIEWSDHKKIILC